MATRPSPFPMSSQRVVLRFPSKNFSSVMAWVPMFTLLLLFRSTVKRESEGMGLSLTCEVT